MKLIKFILVITAAMLTTNTQVASQIEDIEHHDPYLWLEEVEGSEALEWVMKQNEHSDQAITKHPLFEPIRKKYLAVFNDKDKIAYPEMVGDYVYNLWQDDTHVRGLWRRMLRSDYILGRDLWEEVLDLDELSAREGKKWVFDGAEWLAPDNKICLLALSDGGTDENVVREFNAETKTFVRDGFHCKPSKGGVNWIDENTVLVYRDFGDGSLTSSGYPREVKIWKRGTVIDEATKIFTAEAESVGAFAYETFIDDERFVFVYNAITFYSSELYYLSEDRLLKLNFPIDANVEGFHKNQLIIALQSDWDINGNKYQKGALVSFDLKENLIGEFDIHEIYKPGKRSSFSSLGTLKDHIVVNALDNVQNRLSKFTFDGQHWKESKIDAPKFGSINLTTYSDHSNDFFFRYSNFITPTTLYVHNEVGLTKVEQLKAIFNPENYVVNQYSATSKDGTKVPYFVVHKKNLEYNGLNPTLIYAYGGFNNSSKPSYRSTVGIGWLEQGGVYVLANIRGGGEFGPEWHQSAIKEKKQNSYDDFFAVAEDLIEQKITSPQYLGAFGWSNGGLMAGVAFTQRPDLFEAVVCGAPLLDMKRYSQLLAGASWMGEYGNPDIPEEWAYIKKYSPYQNLSADKTYPQVFFVTSTKDDRVHPGHARKMAARMSEMDHPFLYHETIEGGHGAASTNEQQAYMWAMIYTYFNMKLNESTISK